MKQVVYIFLILLFCPMYLEAQQTKEIKTLLSESSRISGYGSLHYGVMPFNNKYVGYLGGDGAIVLNNFFLGGYSYRNLGFFSVYPEDEFFADNQLSISHGGITTGVNLRTDKLLQASLVMQVGWGHLSKKNERIKKITERDRINVFSPGVLAKLNLTSFIQVCAGVSYQFLTGIDFPTLKEKDFCGFTGSFSIRFGWF